MRIIFALFLVLSICLAGCSTTDSVNKADEFGDEISLFEKEIDLFVKEGEISDAKQQDMASRMEKMHEAIQGFKNADDPVLLRKVKELGYKELDKKDKVLLEVQQKAAKGEATLEDIKKVQKAFVPDVRIRLFE